MSRASGVPLIKPPSIKNARNANISHNDKTRAFHAAVGQAQIADQSRVHGGRQSDICRIVQMTAVLDVIAVAQIFLVH